MSQLLRQIGVVIGLTVILTFPVTVVSGAGSEKQPDHDHMARGVAATGGKGQVAQAMRTLGLEERVKYARTRH
jgi:hypothetical protein